MEAEPRSAGERLWHGCCGAALGAALAICVQLSWGHVNWWVPSIWGGVGFIVGWLVGEEALELLGWLSWWR